MLARAQVRAQAASARVFFALWPEAATAERMAQIGAELAARTGGRAVAATALHMTLVFVGSVPEQALAKLTAAAASVRECSFALMLDRAGSWRQSGIGWLAPSAAPVAVLELGDCLRAALRQQQIAFDAKRFAPHVTVVRKLSKTLVAATVQPIEWPVHEFVLLRSRLAADGASYEPIGRWALADG